MSKGGIRETIGVLGVVASLLFVGLAIRQSTNETPFIRRSCSSWKSRQARFLWTEASAI